MIEQAWATGQACCLCGGRFHFKGEITAEHIEALRHGGKPDGPLGPAHKRCNSAWRRFQAAQRDAQAKRGQREQ